MNVREFLKDNIVLLDGGMGTLLQAAGLRPGELPETWNLTHPDEVEKIQRAYFDAGCNVVNTNTFGANIFKFTKIELEEIIKSAIDIARRAAKGSVGTQEKFVALDIGPSGRMLEPYGDLAFEDAVSLFAETVRLGEKYGADLIMIETMGDSYETKAALLAAKENSSLPVFVSNAYGEDGKLMTGASPAAMVAMAEGLGADAIGANCSLGPKRLMGVVSELLANSSVPVLLKPNAGLPQSEGGRTYYDVDAEEFACDVAQAIRMGVRVAGGCCGTTPEYIRALAEKAKDIAPVPLTEKNLTVVSSYTHAVRFGTDPVLIGERINPTGKKRLKQALKEHDIDYILGEGIKQEENGAHVLDVNVGLPEIDEKEMLCAAVRGLQGVIPLPLQIDTADARAMEAALRIYNGKAMINSVSGKEQSMREIFPLVKKYGGVVVALTLDDGGIPKTAEERVRIAERIVSVAAEYGIKKKDIIFDTLAMTVSADGGAALATLGALRKIRYGLGCNTSLGVSNVSFGLPCREVVNSTFFALALENGLSAAIMNPGSADMMKTYYAYRALHGMDENCADYIGFASALPAPCASAPAQTAASAVQSEAGETELQRAIIKGLREKAAALTCEMLESVPALDIVSGEIIPALDAVGKGFEAKTVYLPQLLISAEAAKSSFEQIKKRLSQSGESVKKCDFVLATVEGDVHDIGKNIVKLLLENYGFNVIDLGKDVPAEAVAAAVEKYHAPLAGLSALMTTTVPAMEETIKLLRVRAPWCRVVVGGAVLTAEYAQRIGADKYAADAMESVRYAEEICASLS